MSEDRPTCSHGSQAKAEPACSSSERHWKKRILYTFIEEQHRVSDVTIHNLSDPVLLEIFRYLDTIDKLRLAGVCRRFYCLLRDRHLWKHVDLCGCDNSFNGRTLHRLLNRYILSGQLRTINLPRRFATNAVIRKVLKRCCNLERLSFTRTTLSRKLRFAELPRNLRQVSFIECFAPRSAGLFSRNETSLSFDNVRFSGYKSHYQLRSCLRFLKNVKSLTIDQCECFNSTLSLRELAEQNPDLNELYLCNLPDLGDDAIAGIAQFIPNVTTLTLRANAKLTEGCFEHIKEMKKLKTIDVAENPQFDNETLRKFIVEHSKFNR